MPWYVNAFLKLVNPFIDPVTKTKIKPNEPLPNHVPVSQLMTVSGGEVDFKYDHSIYWPALDKLTSEKRQQRIERWEKGGKLIGESEIYLWGGDEGSLGEKTEALPANGEATIGEKVGDQAELADGVAKLEVKNEDTIKTAI